jgi:hypothetical protein
VRQVRRIRINAAPEKVWELIDDEAKIPSWMPHIVATRYPDGKRRDNPVGTRFVQEMREGDQIVSYDGEVTEYDRGRLLGVLLRPQAFAIHAVYHVSGDEDWTLLDYGCDVKPQTWRGYLMVWWGRRLLNSILDQQLARLKLVAEGKMAGL